MNYSERGVALWDISGVQNGKVDIQYGRCLQELRYRRFYKESWHLYEL